ncbi:MAG: hypothetical protein GXO35_08715, partial [Gammaproteobacteria bacterium]|nr:hypothetical protein [Gammaproteobacteria bacterium]
MKLAVIPLCLAMTFGFASQAYAMKLSGESMTYSKVYKPTETAVMKTLDKMGIDHTVDDDGDLVYIVPGKDWSAYVIFSHTGASEKLWNVQMRVQFATKKSRYDEVIEFANEWNATKKAPKVAMKDR